MSDTRDGMGSVELEALLKKTIAERDELREELRQVKADHSAEVDEFNDGFKAARGGLDESAEPTHCPYDVWLCGYAWGRYEKLKEEIHRLSLALRQEILRTADLEVELNHLRGADDADEDQS